MLSLNRPEASAPIPAGAEQHTAAGAVPGTADRPKAAVGQPAALASEAAAVGPAAARPPPLLPHQLEQAPPLPAA
eukprot:3015618-Alexandrium_andersonii.AAC.1